VYVKVGVLEAVWVGVPDAVWEGVSDEVGVLETIWVAVLEAVGEGVSDEVGVPEAVREGVRVAPGKSSDFRINGRYKRWETPNCAQTPGTASQACEKPSAANNKIKEARMNGLVIKARSA
jgi:hypothetical protein